MDQVAPAKKTKQSFVQKLKATYRRKRSKLSKHDVKHAEVVEVESQTRKELNGSHETSLTKVSIPEAKNRSHEATIVEPSPQQYKEAIRSPGVTNSHQSPRSSTDNHFSGKKSSKKDSDGTKWKGRAFTHDKQLPAPGDEPNRGSAKQRKSQGPVEAPLTPKKANPPPPEPPILYCTKCGESELWKNPKFPLHLAALDFLCVICRSGLLSLPLELFQEVQSYLDTNSLWLLRLSCKRLWNAIPPPSSPKEGKDVEEFFRLIRSFVPRRMQYCSECVKYHRWESHIYFWWDDKQRCRRAAGADNQLSFYGGCLGIEHFVCKHCNTRRRYSHCTLCFKCEACVGKIFKSRLANEGGRVTIKGTPIYCRSCISLKTDCSRCYLPTLAKQSCHKCGKCEKCSNTLFQFGETRCRECGGGGLSMSSNTRRVAVERGQGYEMYYYASQTRNTEPTRIGMR